MAEISDREALAASAARLGLTPIEWGGLMSYESGLDPTRWGGAGGRHVGLIQFGPAEQKAFGVTGRESFQEQLPKAEAFLMSRGYQPGMGLMQAYSTVNAGSPGRLNASDASNGGMPGTVADKVNNQFGPHFKRAAAFLGSDFVPTMPPGTNSAQAAPFGFRAPSTGGDAPVPQPSAPDDTAEVAAILRTLMPRQPEQPAPAPQEAPAPAPMLLPETGPAPQYDASRIFSLLPATARRRACPPPQSARPTWSPPAPGSAAPARWTPMPNPNAWSPDPPSNASIDAPIYWPEGMSPGAVNDSARAMMAAIACLLRDTTGTLNASGTNAYALGLNQSITSLDRTFEVAFFVSSANTGPATLSVNGLDAKPIERRLRRPIGPGDLAPDVLYRALYNTTRGVYVITSPEIAAPGTIRMQAGPSVDPGWLPCDGRTVSRSVYTALRDAIGDTYGAGDGATTFSIPDLRGRAPFGVDGGANRLTGAGNLFGGLGNTGGGETVVLTAAQIASHTHTGQALSGGASDGGTTGPGGDHSHSGSTGSAGAHGHGVTIDQGGSHTHNGQANIAGGEARAFSFAAGGLTPGGAAQYVADINAGNVFDNKRQTSGDNGHVHSVTIPQSGDHGHTGSVTQAVDHQHTIPGSGTHTHTLPGAAAHTHDLAINAAGQDQGHPTIPPAIVVQFVIKT